jgi:hypothetical protein
MFVVNLTLTLNELFTESPPGRPAKAHKITQYFVKSSDKSMECTLARMASRDGLPFSVFCTSLDLRNALIAYGFSALPSSPTTIRNKVVEYAKTIKAKHAVQIAHHKSEGKKFSVTFDEWTSHRNRRYLNLILHGGVGQEWNLGVVRIHGSTSSEHCLKLVKEKLMCYNISLQNDIVSIATDGTSMMTKIGKLSPTHQQLCFAHGVQLAVVDVLYSKKKVSEPSEPQHGNDRGSYEEDGSEFVNYDSGSEESELSEDDAGFEVSATTGNVEVGHIELMPIISKVRSIVKMFRRSPLKNDLFQKHVLADFAKELKLVLDSKTRWTSLLEMVERFVQLKNCVQNSLRDLESKIRMEETEWQAIEDLVRTLQPVKATVQALCRRDSDLFTADLALQYTLDKLKEQNTTISREMGDALGRRILQRRTEVSGLVKYLYKGEIDKDKTFGTPKSVEIINLIKSFVERLQSSNPETNPAASQALHQAAESSEQSEAEVQVCISSHSKAKRRKNKNETEAELDTYLKDALSTAHIENSDPKTGLSSTIKKEMNLFQGGGSRGRNLQLVFEYLKTIPPTSVGSERAFSSAGYLCNKIRSSLNDDTLDSLCLLRSHFQTQE